KGRLAWCTWRIPACVLVNFSRGVPIHLYSQRKAGIACIESRRNRNAFSSWRSCWTVRRPASLENGLSHGSHWRCPSRDHNCPWRLERCVSHSCLPRPYFESQSHTQPKSVIKIRARNRPKPRTYIVDTYKARLQRTVDFKIHPCAS